MSQRLSFGPVRTRPDVASQLSPRPVRLTTRGETVAAVLVGVVLFGAIWGASALGYWLTGAAG